MAHLDELRQRYRRYRVIHVIGDNASFHKPNHCRKVKKHLEKWGHRVRDPEVASYLKKARIEGRSPWWWQDKFSLYEDSEVGHLGIHNFTVFKYDKHSTASFAVDYLINEVRNGSYKSAFRPPIREWSIAPAEGSGAYYLAEAEKAGERRDAMRAAGYPEAFIWSEWFWIGGGLDIVTTIGAPRAAAAAVQNDRAFALYEQRIQGRINQSFPLPSPKITSPDLAPNKATTPSWKQYQDRFGGRETPMTTTFQGEAVKVRLDKPPTGSTIIDFKDYNWTNPAYQRPFIQEQVIKDFTTQIQKYKTIRPNVHLQFSQEPPS